MLSAVASRAPRSGGRGRSGGAIVVPRLLKNDASRLSSRQLRLPRSESPRNINQLAVPSRSSSSSSSCRLRHSTSRTLSASRGGGVDDDDGWIPFLGGRENDRRDGGRIIPSTSSRRNSGTATATAAPMLSGPTRRRQLPFLPSSSSPVLASPSRLRPGSSSSSSSTRRSLHHVHVPANLTKEAATAPRDAPVGSRWWAVPPANAVHLSIGSVYVYSMWTPGMTHALGVVSASADDWSHGQVLPVFSASAIVLGLTTATLGSWVEKVGPRFAGAVGSALWSSALVMTAAGIHLHSLPLVYGGWGLLGGIGWGLMYLCPVTTVMKWFPDRRGLATGLALSAFGAGAAIAPAFIHAFVDFFSVVPDYIGPLSELSGGAVPVGECVSLETLPDGTQVVSESSPVGTPGTPVVVATEGDLAKLHQPTPGGPGAYVLGSGDNGTAKAMAALGLCYGALGMLGSRFMTLPHPDWTPDGPVVRQQVVESGQQPPLPAAVRNTNDVGLPVDFVTSSTRQYPLLWLTVFGNATGGLALVTSSKLMLTDIYAGVAPEIVTASFATGYVSALGVGMAGGRFGWAAISDYLGRRNTYALFGLGIPIIGLSPWLTHAAVVAAASSGGDASASTSTLPMVAAFCGGSYLAITFYGGVFSVLPAYIADLFGQKHSGAIHGKLLTAWAASAVAGPMGLAYLRSLSVERSTSDLLQKVQDPAAFEKSFGCGLDDAETIRTLVDAKTITIGRLMEMVPPETLDPTPFLYDSSCYAAASLMGVAFVSNLFIKPLDVPQILSDLEKDGKLKEDD